MQNSTCLPVSRARGDEARQKWQAHHLNTAFHNGLVYFTQKWVNAVVDHNKTGLTTLRW